MEGLAAATARPRAAGRQGTAAKEGEGEQQEDNEANETALGKAAADGGCGLFLLVMQAVVPEDREVYQELKVGLSLQAFTEQGEERTASQPGLSHHHNMASETPLLLVGMPLTGLLCSTPAAVMCQV